jgi:hypothetical protein
MTSGDADLATPDLCPFVAGWMVAGEVAMDGFVPFLEVFFAIYLPFFTLSCSREKFGAA